MSHGGLLFEQLHPFAEDAREAVAIEDGARLLDPLRGDAHQAQAGDEFLKRQAFLILQTVNPHQAQMHIGSVGIHVA